MIKREEIAIVLDGYHNLDIPVELKESVVRHQQHLAALVSVYSQRGWTKR